MDDNLLKNIIKEQKEELNEWKNNLKNNLSKNLNKKEVIVLITKKWLYNYEKSILDTNNRENFNEDEFNEEIKDINNDLFNSFNDKKINIEKFPMMFPLSKNVWMKLKNYTNNDLNTITTTGKFGNKILILKVLETVYCLFFLDDKGKIRQGYLEFFGKGYEEVIVNNF